MTTLRQLETAMRDERRSPDGSHEDPLQRDIERVVGALAVGVGKGIAIAAEAIEEHQRERAKTKERRAYEKDLTKAERRRAKAEARYAGTSAIEGTFLVGTSLAAALFIAFNPDLWIVGVPAFFTMLRGVRILGFHNERQKHERHLRDDAREKREASSPKPAGPVVDPREAAVQERCDRLQAAIRASSEVVKEFLSHPEETVAGLRQASLDLLAREKKLRALASPDEQRRLVADRDKLVRRIAGESDTLTRQRYEAALAALDAQRDQHAALIRNADRLEAEQMRLAYVIDGLHAQVLRVAAAGKDTAEAQGMRERVDALRTEMSALADAVEQVNAQTPTGLDRELAVPPGDAESQEFRPDRARSASR